MVNAYTSAWGFYLNNCQGTSSNTSLMANNFIVLDGSANSTRYGVYSTGCHYINYYYNSFRINGGNASASAILVTGGSNIQLLNNIFAITAGTGYGFHIATPSAITACDYNNFYSTGANVAYWIGAQPTLAALTSASLMDSNSVNIPPPFISIPNLHLSTNTLSGLAIPIAVVTDDIDGNPRTTKPTIGAQEIPNINKDGALISLIFPDTVIESSIYPVKAVIKNLGFDPLFSFPVFYSLNHGSAVMTTYNDTLLTGTADTLSLPPLSAPGGNASLCAYTQIQGDSNNFNDTLCVSFFGKPLWDAQLVEILPMPNGCGLGMDTVSVVIKNLGLSVIHGNISGSYQMKGSANVVVQNIPAVISVGDSLIFHFSTLADFSVTTSDSLFDIKAWVTLVGDNVHYNDSGFLMVQSNYTPAQPLSNNIPATYGTPANLTATTNTGGSLEWTIGSPNGTLVGTGSTFTTGILYSDTSFWVKAVTGKSGTFAFGTGSTTNSITGYPSPYTNYYGGSKHQMLIRASELMAAGILPGQRILSISFDVAQIGTAFGGVLNNFRIDMGQTPFSTLNNYFFASGLTNVLPEGNIAVISGINTHLLATPFVWDGVNHLVIQTSYSNGNNGTTDEHVLMKNCNTGFVSTNWYRADITSAVAVFSSTIPSGAGNMRPNMTLSVTGGGCTSPGKVVQVTITGQPACDVGVDTIYQPISAISLSNAETVRVRVKNYGTSSQSNIPVNFQIDNGAVFTDTITTTIAAGDTLIWFFTAGAPLDTIGNTYFVKSWTSLPCDIYHLNDTAWKSVQNLVPNYCQPIYTTGSGDGDYITQVILLGLNNLSFASGPPYYTNYGNMGNVILNPGFTYDLVVLPGSNSNNNAIAAWIDFNRDGDFYDPNENIGEVPINGPYPFDDTITFTVPMNAVNGMTRMRLREVYNTTGIDPCATYTWGETEDYEVMITQQINKDAGVVAIVQPGKIFSGTATPIQLNVTNFGNDSLFSIPVQYSFNGNTPATYNWSGVLVPKDTVMMTLPSATVLLGRNTLCVNTNVAGDNNGANDTACIVFYNVPVWSAPYFEDFEGVDYWYPDTIANQWERGVPAAAQINTSHSPINVWMTQLDTTYLNNSTDYLYSPLFDFNAVSPDSLIFWHYYSTETYMDFCNIEYRNAYGGWNMLGLKNDTNGVNWYNTNISGSIGWTGNSQGWTRSAYDLTKVSNFGSVTQFRFVFSTNAVYNLDDGWALDDFHITALANSDDVGIEAILQPVNNTIAGHVITVEAKIKNYGTNTQTLIPVSYAVDGTLAASENWTGTLAAGDVVNYTFSTPYTALPADYLLCASTNLPGDTNPGNDSICQQLLLNGMEDLKTNSFLLRQNIPNPTSGYTSIGFHLPKSGELTFKVVDVLGQPAFLETKKQTAGDHSIELNLSHLPNGIYYYSLEFEGHSIVKKMVIAK